MKKSSLFFLAPLLALSGLAHAAPLDRDLGQGLTYCRVHQLPADLPTAESDRRQPCVLDLRYVHGDATAAAALAAWLKFHATAHAPVLVLANADTARVLLAPLTGREPAGSVVVIGAAAPGFNPDIAVKASDDAERRAYDALEHGAAIESLLVENADKPRNDEARLAKDHVPEAPPPAEDAATGSTSAPPAEDKPANTKPSPPPVDAALQRAVQLHRTLVALKKI